tara:strand:- start:963 stop:2984 length:2022 start_codon:yes stop_codon:yes gene_type:complete
MPSKITLLFNVSPNAGSVLALQNSVGFNGLMETFQGVRTGSYQSAISTDLVTTVLNYRAAFESDYSASSLFTTTWYGSTVTVEHPNKFYFQTGSIINVDENGVSSSDISVSITDTDDPIEINIDTIAFTQGTTPCNNVKSNITTNVLATKYRINYGAEVVNSSNPFIIENIRGQVKSLIVENAEGNQKNQIIQLPDLLVSANINTNLVNSPSGATITINVSNQYGLTLEYSLDDTVWQSGNVYTGILEGTYTVYVRDQLGCKVSISLSVPAFENGGIGQRFPYSDLPSKSNSIRFAKYINWGSCGNYKNDENTLSDQLGYTQNLYCYEQLFQDCDVITTQLKTNYENIVATVVEVDGTETVIPTVKKSQNTNQKDRRDAIKYNLAGLGVQTGIYFTSGDKYDYDTGAVTGDYTLNGGLPSWGELGNYVFVSGGWFEIVNIVYDDSKNAYVLVINEVYNGVDAIVEVSSVFNYDSYEIWEFVIDMNNFANKKIQVNVAQTDSDTSFPEVVYLSELIDIKPIQEDTVLIEYYNEGNTDIFYSTGIKNKIRMPIEYMIGGYVDSTETEKTDSNSYLVEAEAYENDLIAFKLISKQMMRKVVQALSHKFVFLNDVQYVKEESPEITPLIGTNQYRVTARMTKANAVYTSKGRGEVFNAGTFEVPSLLETESDGYLKI